MPTNKSGNPVEDAWNKTRGDGDPEFQQTSPDFRAKLQQVYGAALAGQAPSGIAGLEKFEAEIRSGVKADASRSVEPGTPTVIDPAARVLGEQQQAEPQPKGSGAQAGSKAKALKDAAAAGSRVEANETHSPSFPSAARPLAAESPGNAPEEGGDARSTSTASKSASKRTASKKSAAKAASKTTSKKK